MIFPKCTTGYGNISSRAGALYNDRGTCDAYNITTVGNGSTEYYDEPPTGLYSSPASELNLYNSIVWDRISESTEQIHTNYCLLKGVAGKSSDIDGRFVTQEQIFRNFTGRNYRLSDSCPVINAGSNKLVDSKTDLDGKPRIYNEGNGGIVDLGAYEFQGEKVYPAFLDSLIQVSGSCFGDTAMFTINNFDRDSIQWDFGDGSRATTFRQKSVLQQHRYQEAGTYVVHIAVFSGNKQNNFTKKVDIGSFSLDLGKDTAVCPHTIVSLNSNIADADFLWQDGSTQPDLTVESAGTYWLEVTKNGCKARDSIVITEIPVPDITIAGNRMFCPGDTILLKAESSGLKNVRWADGYQGTVHRVTEAGTYSVEATTEDGCIAGNTIQVSTFPQKELSVSGNREFCQGDSITLSVTDTDLSSIVWNGLLSSPFIMLRDGGQVTVTAVTPDGCPVHSAVNVGIPYQRPTGFLLPLLEICRGTTSEIKTSENFMKYAWSTGSSAPSIYVNTPGIYVLSVGDANGCTGTDSIRVSLKDCNGSLVFPNAFTPNQDGLNDKFGPVVVGGINIMSFHLLVYNRWGNLLFRSDNVNDRWDGLYRGHIQPSGSYVWFCTYLTNDKITQQKRGMVVLLR